MSRTRPASKRSLRIRIPARAAGTPTPSHYTVPSAAPARAASPCPTSARTSPSPSPDPGPNPDQNHAPVPTDTHPDWDALLDLIDDAQQHISITVMYLQVVWTKPTPANMNNTTDAAWKFLEMLQIMRSMYAAVCGEDAEDAEMREIVADSEVMRECVCLLCLSNVGAWWCGARSLHVRPHRSSADSRPLPPLFTVNGSNGSKAFGGARREAA